MSSDLGSQATKDPRIDAAKAQYKDRICACQRPVRDEDTEWAWLEYLKATAKISGDPHVYNVPKAAPRAEGYAETFRFIRGEIDAAAFYRFLRDRVGPVYYDALVSLDMIAAGQAEVEFLELCKVTSLEAVAAYSRLVGKDLRLPETCHAIAIVMATCWYRFAEAAHQLLGLPAMSEIARGIALKSTEETEILAGGDFSAYELSPDERTKLAISIGLDPAERPK